MRKNLLLSITVGVVVFAITLFVSEPLAQDYRNKIECLNNEMVEMYDEFEVVEANYKAILKEKDKDYEELNKKYSEKDSSLNEITKLYNKMAQSKIYELKKVLKSIESIKNYDKKYYLKCYKNVVKNYAQYIDVPPTIYDIYTQEEINIMCRCIETEVYQAPFDSKVNVASVILNRIKSKDFPNNPIEVITGKNQFCYDRTNITNDTIQALEYAYLFGDTTNGCVAFRSNACPMKWCAWTYQFTDEVGHNFYK